MVTDPSAGTLAARATDAGTTAPGCAATGRWLSSFWPWFKCCAPRRAPPSPTSRTLASAAADLTRLPAEDRVPVRPRPRCSKARRPVPPLHSAAAFLAACVPVTEPAGVLAPHVRLAVAAALETWPRDPRSGSSRVHVPRHRGDRRPPMAEYAGNAAAPSPPHQLPGLDREACPCVEAASGVTPQSRRRAVHERHRRPVLCDRAVRLLASEGRCARASTWRSLEGPPLFST